MNGIVDFAMMTTEFVATRAMMEKKDAEILKQHKKAPVPKL